MTTTITSAHSRSSGSGVSARTWPVESVNVVDVGIVEPDIPAAGGESCQDVGRRGVARVAHVRLEGDTQDPDVRALERAAAVVERLPDQVDDVTRHGEVDVAGELDEAIDEVEFAGAPRQVVRIDRDAVAADARDRA